MFPAPRGFHPSLVFAISLLPVLACSPPPPEAGEPAVAASDVLELTEQAVASAGLRSEVVAASEIRQTVRVPATVDAPDTERAVVGAILEGRVARIHVLPGDGVRAGDPLVEIHGHEVFGAQAGLTAAEAELEVAREAAGRAQRLYDGGAISLEELQRRTATLTSAEAERGRAAELVEHLYPTADGNASAVAPTDGTVFSVEVSPGQVVLPGTPLVHMGSSDRLWATAYVPEGVSTRMEPGDEVAVEFLSDPSIRSRGVLVQGGRYVNAENRSVELRFELVDPPKSVRPGSFASVLVGTTEVFTGVELPADAAVRMGDANAVFVEVGAGRYEPRMVEVMPLGDGRVAVEGLETGARVVIEGAYFLKSVVESGQGAGEGDD